VGKDVASGSWRTHECVQRSHLCERVFSRRNRAALTGVKTKRIMLISTARIQAWLAAPFLLIALDTACSKAPHLTEYDEHANSQARSAPLVVVGVADSDIPIGRPVPSRHDPDYPMQLHRVKVRIENILKGSAGERTISVYYFEFAGGFDGPRPLGFGRQPSRRILWLRKDGRSFRMACDGWDGCTELVTSGAHTQYSADPQQPLNRALTDILLTRGEGEVSDLQFASQIQWSIFDQGIQDYVIEKLRHLALTEVSEIKISACQQLWIYTQDRIDDRLRERAQDSLDAASCICGPKPGVMSLCQ